MEPDMEEEIRVTNSWSGEHCSRKYPCGCSSLKYGLLAAGLTELVLGTTGLALIFLGPQKRHLVLYPLEDSPVVEVFSEQWEDSIQLLIEYWMPSLAYWILGAVLIYSAITRKTGLLVFWIFISTLLLAGSIAGILALIVAGASIVGLLPLILATLLQIYFYLVISDMTYFQWRTAGNSCYDDKIGLVDSTV